MDLNQNTLGINRDGQVLNALVEKDVKLKWVAKALWNAVCNKNSYFENKVFFQLEIKPLFQVQIKPYFNLK